MTKTQAIYLLVGIILVFSMTIVCYIQSRRLKLLRKARDNMAARLAERRREYDELSEKEVP